MQFQVLAACVQTTLLTPKRRPFRMSPTTDNLHTLFCFISLFWMCVASLLPGAPLLCLLCKWERPFCGLSGHVVSSLGWTVAWIGHTGPRAFIGMPLAGAQRDTCGVSQPLGTESDTVGMGKPFRGRERYLWSESTIRGQRFRYCWDRKTIRDREI